MKVVLNILASGRGLFSKTFCDSLVAASVAFKREFRLLEEHDEAAFNAIGFSG
jgi:hypothetical protein